MQTCKITYNISRIPCVSCTRKPFCIDLNCMGKCTFLTVRPCGTYFCMKVSTDTHTIGDSLRRTLDFFRTVNRAKYAPKAKRIGKGVTLVFVHAEAVSQACNLCK